MTTRYVLPDNGKERRPPRSVGTDQVEAPQERKLEPQRGPQKRFLTSRADIAIYGGAAGGGKTWALLLQPQRHVAHDDFSAVFFRRTTVQIRNPGGLWDESLRLYAGSGGEPFAASLEWRFPSGAKVKFAHLEHEKSVLEWQGAQAPLICFDELLHLVRHHPYARARGPFEAALKHPRLRWAGGPAAYVALAYINAGHPNPRKFLEQPEVAAKFARYGVAIAAFAALDFD